MVEPLDVRTRDPESRAASTVSICLLTDSTEILRWWGPGGGRWKTSHPGGFPSSTSTGKEYGSAAQVHRGVKVHRLAYRFGWDERDRGDARRARASLLETTLIDHDPDGTRLRSDP